MSHELLESDHIFINPSTGLVSFGTYSQLTLFNIKTINNHWVDANN